MNTKTLILAACLASIALANNSAHATAYWWVCGSDSWDAACWSTTPGGSLSPGYPVTGDMAYLTSNDAVNRVVTYPTSGTTISSIAINAGGTGTFTLSLSADSLIVNNMEIAILGTGNFSQTGGTASVTNQLTIGSNSGSNGSYMLSGTGNMNALTGWIGYNGTGNVTQSNDTQAVYGNLYLGAYSGSTGNYSLSDNGSLGVTNEYIGYFGTGVFVQNGGSHTVSNNFHLGSETGGSGSYVLSGNGSLYGGYESIGISGNGSFSQSGGTHTVYQLVLGAQPTGVGSYNLSGTGSLVASNLLVGGSGSGSFIQSGGTVMVNNVLFVGANAGNGNYQMSGGSLSVATNEYIGDWGNGSFKQSAGTHTVAMDLYISRYAGGGGYELSGTGNLSAFNEFLGYGSSATFTQTGGTNTVTGALAVGYGNTGSYSLSGGALSSNQQFIGYQGNGNFIHTAGSNTTAQLALGWDFWAEGSYQLGGTGNLTVTQGDELIGANGKGAFTQSGGTHSVNNNIILGHNYGSSGTYNLSGGSVSAGILYVAYGGSAGFTQDGGTVAIAGLAMGISDGRHNQYEDIPASNGIYHLNDGILTTGYETIGSSGVGTFNQNGGTNTVTNNIQLGWNATGAGTYNLGAGSLSTGNVYVSNAGVGVFNQTGGTSHITNRLYLGASGGTGSYNLSAGTLSVADEYIGNYSTGTFIQTGGTHSVSGTIQLAAASIIYGYPNSGTFDLAGGKLDATNIVVNNGGAFNFTGGTLAVGHFTGNLLNNGGTLAPGHSPGVTTITGNYTQSALGSYAVEIGGLLAGSEHDLLSISGSASLAGSLNVSLIDLGSGLFTPQVGDTFDILTAETITGTFDILSFANLINPSLSWHIDYLTDAIGTTDVVRLSVVASAVPLPAAVWLLGSGLMGIIGFGRRKKQ